MNGEVSISQKNAKELISEARKLNAVKVDVVYSRNIREMIF